jgi:class 3 adenylate cyclase
MNSNLKPYVTKESVERIDAILTSSDTSYEDVDSIPSRERLTFTNGFYVNCSCMFIDIRGSSQLPSQYQRPTLGKIYRTFVSECVAVMNSSDLCREINIQGDAVWGVFNTPYKPDISAVFSKAAMLSSVVDILNCRYARQTRNIKPISVGIGVAFGRALMIKAGYSGSGINDVVWMGDVVNHASALCGYGNATAGDKEIMVANDFYSNLDEASQRLLSKNYGRDCYHGNVVSTAMNEWVDTNCG